MMRILATLLCVSVANLGCYRAAVRAPVSEADGGREYSDIGAVWLWGATRTTSKAVECRNGLARTQTKIPWWGVLFIVPLTIGIITPIRTHYTCAAPAGPDRSGDFQAGFEAGRASALPTLTGE